MAAAISPSLDFGKTWSAVYKNGMAVSIVIHLLILVGIPVALQIIQGSTRFERPPTFQLVVAPPSLQPLKPVQKLPKNTPVRRTVKKDAVRQVPKSGDKPLEENVDELASMLDELPAPTKVSAVGDTKFNLYYAEVQQKIQQFWNPPTENKNLSVIVAFTIFSSGEISEPSIEKSSGDGTLDKLALGAVRSAAPFPKFPLSMTADKKEFTCTLIPMRK
jgi:TonB family protein